MKTETVKLSQVQVNEANPRTITNEKFQKLVNSVLALPKMLELRPIVVDNMMVALGGNMRFRALTAISDLSEDELKSRLFSINDVKKKTEGEQQALLTHWLRWRDNPTAIIIKASELSDAEQREFIIKDNIGYGEWDTDSLTAQWDNEELVDWGIEFPDAENALNAQNGSGSGSEKQNSAPESSLFDRFIVPPFSILDTRKGYWQDRKKKWYDIIGDMGESRNDTLVTSLEIKYKDLYQRTREHRKELGISFKEYIDKYVSQEDLEKEQAKIVAQGVSILDPVMAEIVCRWFGQENGKAFDCFAGDSVFGFVAAYLGNDFTGVELREKQAALNNERVEGMNARYICDDGQNVAQHIEPESQDLLFSCPPYFDLEKYSDLPNDASNQGSYEDFIKILENAFTGAVSCLKENRFAAICVGDVRDKNTGFYYDFCGDIKRIFKQNGMRLYNEIILVEQTASTALRASRYMDSRKVAKTHQHLLVFFKGDPKKIKKEFPKIEYKEDDLELFNTSEEETSTVVSNEARTQLGGVIKDLIKFREQFIKKKVIMYLPYPHIQKAYDKGQIHIHRNESGEICGYLWLNDRSKLQVSCIEEICSVKRGLGSEMIEWAKSHAQFPVLELKVVDFNKHAYDFYLKHGFVEVSREKGKKINNITMHYAS